MLFIDPFETISFVLKTMAMACFHGYGVCVVSGAHMFGHTSDNGARILLLVKQLGVKSFINNDRRLY